MKRSAQLGPATRSSGAYLSLITLVVVLASFVAQHPAEAASSLVVTNTHDSGRGSLRQAIIRANDEPGPQAITFSAQALGVMKLKSALPPITNDMRVVGPGSDYLTVIAPSGSSAFTVATGANLTLSGVSITGRGSQAIISQSGLILDYVVIGERDVSPAEDGVTLNVSSTNDAGPGSLRQAIVDANANPDSNLIAFSDSASGRIRLLTPLPPLTSNTDIQGPGTNRLILDASLGGPALTVGPGASVTVSSLILSGTGNLLYNQGHLTLENLQIPPATSSLAGAVTLYNATFPTYSGSLDSWVFEGLALTVAMLTFGPLVYRTTKARSLPAAAGALLPRSVTIRTAISLYALVLALYLITTSGHFFSIDEYGTYDTTASIVERHSLEIAPRPRNVLERNGKFYAVSEPGQAIASIPLYELGRIVEHIAPPAVIDVLSPVRSNASIFFVSLFNQLVTPLIVVLVYLFCLQFGFSQKASALTSVAYGLGTIAWPAAHEYFQHPLETLCLIAAVYVLFAHRTDLKHGTVLLAGAFFGYAVLTRLNVVITLPLVFAYLAWLRVAATAADGLPRASGSFPSQLPSLAATYLRRLNSRELGYFALFLLPVFLVLAIIVNVQHLETGRWLTAHNASADIFSLAVLPSGLVGLLLTPGRSFFLFSPPTIAGVLAFRRFFAKYPAEALLFASVAWMYLVFYASFREWDGGLAWGPRYLEPVVPLMVIPSAYFLERRWSAICLLLLTAAGAMISLAGTVINIGDAQEATRLLGSSYLYRPGISPIVLHWKDLLANRHLDLWLEYVFQNYGRVVFDAALALPLLLLVAAWYAFPRHTGETNARPPGQPSQVIACPPKAREPA